MEFAQPSTPVNPNKRYVGLVVIIVVVLVILAILIVLSKNGMVQNPISQTGSSTEEQKLKSLNENNPVKIAPVDPVEVKKLKAISGNDPAPIQTSSVDIENLKALSQ